MDPHCPLLSGAALWIILSLLSRHPVFNNFLEPRNLIPFKPTLEMERQQQIPKLPHPVSLPSSHSSSSPPQSHRQTFFEKLTTLLCLFSHLPPFLQSCITSSHRSLCFPTHGSPNGCFAIPTSPFHSTRHHGMFFSLELSLLLSLVNVLFCSSCLVQSSYSSSVT